MEAEHWDEELLKTWQAEAEAAGRTCLVGALVVDARRRIFVHRRSPQRRLFPNCWDIAGGHVEPGESLLQALERELSEETGWRLGRLLALVDRYEWTRPGGGPHGSPGPVPLTEFDFLVRADGDLSAPRLEPGKATEYRWIGPQDLETLKENRTPADLEVYRLVQRGLQLLASGKLEL